MRMSPEGTDDNRRVSRPFGTSCRFASVPALKGWAILTCPSGTAAEPRLCIGPSTPSLSDIGGLCPT
jgi:hypothetical protein